MKLVFAHMVPFPGRAANTVQVARACASFARIGCDVTLAIPRGRGDHASDAEKLLQIAEAYGIEPIFKIRQFPFFGLPWRELVLGALAACFARSIGADFVFTRSISIARATTFFRVPTILEMHHALEPLRPLVIRRFDALINSPFLLFLVLISGKLKDYFSQRVPALDGRLLSAPLGADAVAARASALALGEGFHVGYVGHLYPGKGMEIVLPLARLCPWARFHVVGGDPVNLQLWQARASDIPNLVFHGHMSHARVPQFLSAFDVVLGPYQRVVEGVGSGENNLADWMSPLKIFEYMAYQKAILCSDLPVLREILTQERTALLCSPDEVASWAVALKRLHDDADLRQRLGADARASLEQDFTREKRARDLIALVREKRPN